MIEFEPVSLNGLISALSTLIGAVGICVGILVMHRSNEGRKSTTKAAAQADARRHAEAMAALADQRRESAEAAEAARQEAGAQRLALEALIERTAATAASPDIHGRQRIGAP